MKGRYACCPFAPAVCQACPAFGVCTKSKEFGRSVTIGPYDAALRRHRVWMSTDDARDAYKRRKPLVEPVFGIIKEQLAARRFLLRGFANVSAEWTLLGTAFNLRTLWRVWCLGVFADLLRGPKASLRFLNRRENSGRPLVAVPSPALALQASPSDESRWPKLGAPSLLRQARMRPFFAFQRAPTGRSPVTCFRPYRPVRPTSPAGLSWAHHLC